MAKVDGSHEIWGFDVKTLACPFDRVTNKKIYTTSKFTAGGGGKGKGVSTLVNAIIKAVNNYIEVLKDPSCLHAIGEQDSAFVVERRSGTNDDINIISYDTDDGACKGCNYNIITESIDVYQLRSKTGKGGQDGAAIFFAMMPHILKEEEAALAFNDYKTEHDLGFTTEETFTDAMAILCDNIYRRVLSDDLKLDIPANAPLPKISKPAIDTGKVSPKSILGGNFLVLKVGATKAHIEAETLKIKEGEFHLELSRELSAKEREMVYPLRSSHRVTENEIRVCKEIKRNWKKGELQIKVLLFEGDAGSGKTQLAKAVSHNMNIPYTKVTCFSDMDKTEVFGSILPVFDADDLDSFSETDQKLLKALYDADESTAATDVIAETLGFPSYIEMYYDPAGTYKRLTGKENPEAELPDCIAEVNRQTMAEWRRLFKMAKEKNNEKKEVSYKYYESEIVRAFKYGYLLEIQEPTMIRDAGILMSLNSALEPDGTLNLPNGVVHAHPDFIAIMTSNRNYAGCKPLNEALRDRVQHAEKMDLPPKEVMIQRGMSVTGCPDINLVSDIAEAITVLDETAKKNAIRGVAGMRSLFQCVDAIKEGTDIKDAILNKIIYKMTTDEEEIAILEDELSKNTALFTETKRRR